MSRDYKQLKEANFIDFAIVFWENANEIELMCNLWLDYKYCNNIHVCCGGITLRWHMLWRTDSDLIRAVRNSTAGWSRFIKWCLCDDMWYIHGGVTQCTHTHTHIHYCMRGRLHKFSALVEKSSCASRCGIMLFNILTQPRFMQWCSFHSLI